MATETKLPEDLPEDVEEALGEAAYAIGALDTYHHTNGMKAIATIRAAFERLTEGLNAARAREQAFRADLVALQSNYATEGALRIAHEGAIDRLTQERDDARVQVAGSDRIAQELDEDRAAWMDNCEQAEKERNAALANLEKLKNAECPKCSRSLPPDGDCYGCTYDAAIAREQALREALEEISLTDDSEDMRTLAYAAKIAHSEGGGDAPTEHSPAGRPGGPVAIIEAVAIREHEGTAQAEGGASDLAAGEAVAAEEEQAVAPEPERTDTDRLDALIALMNEEDSKGEFKVSLEYNNYQDYAVVVWDGKATGLCGQIDLDSVAQIRAAIDAIGTE